MFKVIISCLALVVLANLTSLVASSEVKFSRGEVLSKDDLELAFKELEAHLNNDCGQNDPSCLKAAKRAKASKWKSKETRMQRVARYYVYLSEFDTCEPKTLEYMFDVLRGRSNAEPQKPFPGSRKETRLDTLLQSSLLRASNKCRSFIETWFRDSERKLQPTAKRLLYDLLSHGRIKEKVDGHLGEFFADAALTNATLSKQLAQMDYEQLFGYFADQISDNFIKPCEKYLEVMTPVMKNGPLFGFGYSRWAKTLFDEPSSDFMDSTHRYDRCKFNVGLQGTYIKEGAKRAIRQFNSRRNELVH